MVPKVAGKGTSFKGAGLYYLHDKQASTAERVALTHTENLPTDNAELALKIMAHTAQHQDALKRANGAAKTGRKLVYSVYTYSLSWAPDEAPDHAAMLEAARDTMKALGINEHEALMVIHNDEPHPHVHVIANRVHPQTGLAAKLACDHLILSRWAEAYERAQGQIRCEERVENNKKRRAYKARAQDGFVKHKGLDSADFRRWKRAQERLHAGPALEPNLPDIHRAQRKALYDGKEQRIATRRQALKEQNRPNWAVQYRQQKAEQRELDATRRNAFARVMYWIKHRRDVKTRGGLAGAFEAFRGFYGPDFAEAMTARHGAERKQLSDRISAETTRIIAGENEQYRTDLDMLRHDQAAERKALREAYNAHRPEKQAIAEHPATLSEEFHKRVGRRIRKARKRGGRGKGHGRERE